MKKSKLGIPNLTKNFNEALILSTLFKKPKHGYQIALEIEDRSNGLFKFNHGTLYPILYKLEKEKLIKGVWEKRVPKEKGSFIQLHLRAKNILKVSLSNGRISSNIFLKLWEKQKNETIYASPDRN